MSIAYNVNAITDSLITSIDFANKKSSPLAGTSPITINDLSGNGYYWTTQNGCTINSSSVVLDGNASYIYSSNSNYQTAWSPSPGTYGGSALTIELVFNSSDTSGYLVSRNWNGSGQYNYTMTSGSFGLFANTNGTALGYPNVCTGTNVHMTWWISPTQYGVYQNGQVLVAATNHGLSGYGASSGSGGGGTLIGTLYPYGQGWGGSTGFSVAGTYYLCRIYSRVLSADEVAKNFNATRGRFGL